MDANVHNNVHTFQMGGGFGLSPSYIARIEMPYCSFETLAAPHALDACCAPCPIQFARLNAALEGRYAIERELGKGGMVTVWVGWRSFASTYPPAGGFP